MFFKKEEYLKNLFKAFDYLGKAMYMQHSKL